MTSLEAISAYPAPQALNDVWEFDPTKPEL